MKQNLLNVHASKFFAGDSPPTLEHNTDPADNIDLNMLMYSVLCCHCSHQTMDDWLVNLPNRNDGCLENTDAADFKSCHQC
jgi:hypothetical protein